MSQTKVDAGLGNHVSYRERLPVPVAPTEFDSAGRYSRLRQAAFRCWLVALREYGAQVAGALRQTTSRNYRWDEQRHANAHPADSRDHQPRQQPGRSKSAQIADGPKA